MRIKKITAAVLTGIMVTFSMAGTAFAYTGETEAAESTAAERTASDVKTEAAVTAEGSAESVKTAKKDDSEKETPYNVTASEDGTYTFTFGDYEWSFNPEKEAEADKTGTVTGVDSYLHLRTGAGLDYEIIGHLLPGAQVKVVGEDGDWYKVVVPEQSGYVHSDYLRVMENAAASGELSEELMTVLITMMAQSQQQLQQNQTSEGHGLTPSGNLTLVDDIGPSTGAGQQFITLVSKNGNTFYMVIDRDDDGDENVHFMNLVDEADLFALLDEDAQTAYQEANTPAVTEPEQTETEPEPEAEEEQPEQTAKKSNWAPLMLLFLVGIGGIGFAGYNLMNKKKKEQEAAKPDPDADYQDEDEEEYDLPEEDDYDEDETDALDDEDEDYSEDLDPEDEE